MKRGALSRERSPFHVAARLPDENPRFINSGFEPRPAQPADRSARRDDPSRLLFTWRPGPARLPDENPRFINSGFEPRPAQPADRSARRDDPSRPPLSHWPAPGLAI